MKSSQPIKIIFDQYSQEYFVYFWSEARSKFQFAKKFKSEQKASEFAQSL